MWPIRVKRARDVMKHLKSSCKPWHLLKEHCSVEAKDLRKKFLLEKPNFVSKQSVLEAQWQVASTKVTMEQQDLRDAKNGYSGHVEIS